MQKYYHTTLRLWKLLKPFHKHFYLQLFFIIVTQAINIYSIYLAAQIINHVSNSDFNSAYNYAIYIFLISVVRYAISYFSDKRTIIYLENGVNTFLQEFSLNKIFSLNSAQYVEDHSGIKLIVVNKGEEAVKQIISTMILNLFPTLTQVVFSIITVMYFSPTIGVTTLVIFGIATLLAVKFAQFHQKYIKENNNNWDEFNKNRTETFQHLSLIKNSGMETSYVDKYVKKRFSVVSFDIKTWGMSNLNNKIRFNFFGFGKLIISLQLIYFISQGKILIGDIFAIWSWTNSTFDNIVNVVIASRRLPQYFVELEKYLDLIDKVAYFRETGSKKINVGNLVFENVNFKYPRGEDAVLENLNLTIEQGKKTAFVGFSGSGKSTIIKLLLRIYDWNGGDIKLNGVSLRKLDAQTLRQKIGYVEQHVDLFDISIKENILFGIPSGKLSKEKLDEVVYKSRIEEFFHRLGTAGLDTVIGERGVKLSGGERQRIGIARALAKDPEILIFDEATASLDTENEKYIQEAIDESSKGRTTIIIAHRLSTIQNADKIFVMDKGVIVGEGTDESLLATNEYYQRLVHAQHN